MRTDDALGFACASFFFFLIFDLQKHFYGHYEVHFFPLEGSLLAKRYLFDTLYIISMNAVLCEQITLINFIIYR